MSRRVLTTVVIIGGVTVLARIPGVKLKALDLVVARIQYCPVGKHWSLVVPVRDKDLTEGERQFAREHHDLPIP